MQMVFFSIITPVFNGESFINDTIQSVTNQSFQNWELIIIDDGSIDNSLKIAQDWTKKDKRIKVYTHHGNINKGVSASRNLGIENARGEWLAFLDADDVWEKNKLEKQFEIIEKHDKNLVFIYCKARIFDDKGNFLDKSNTPEYNRKSAIYGAGRPGLSLKPYKWVIKRGFEAPTSSVVIRANTIKNSIRFKEHLTYSEDALFWYNIIEHGDMYFIDKAMLNYRVHATQWNARTIDEVKMGRRYVVYNELLKDSTDKKLIQKLLVVIGIRLIIVYQLFNGFNIKNIWRFLIVFLSRVDIDMKYKFLSIIVLFYEILVFPLKWLNKKQRIVPRKKTELV